MDLSKEDKIMIKEIDGIVYDTEKMYEICSCFPMWGSGEYSILYREEKDKGAFIYEFGVCDMDECEDIESDMMVMSVDEAKEYVKENAENSLGLDIVEDLDELLEFWKEIFGEEINEW